MGLELRKEKVESETLGIVLVRNVRDSARAADTPHFVAGLVETWQHQFTEGPFCSARH